MVFFPTCLRNFLVSGLLLAAAVSVRAQSAGAPPATQLRDGAFRRGTQTYRLQAGQQSLLMAPLTFDNGLTLRPDGRLVSSSGVTRQLLQSGQAVNMQGEVVLLRDDMLTPAAIARHDERVTGGSSTKVEVPAATNLAALLPQLGRTAARLAQLQQLAELLQARAAALAAGTTPTPELAAQIEQLGRGLQP